MPKQTCHGRAGAADHFLSFLFYRIGQSGDRRERQRKGGGEGGEGPIRRQLTEIEEHLPVAVLLKPVSMKLQT